jgi:bifunctional non-homologous end joining protein LigD
MPGFVAPQLARLVDEPPAGAAWVHEIKFDGYRMQLRTEDGSATLRTRKGLDWTDKFQAIDRLVTSSELTVVVVGISATLQSSSVARTTPAWNTDTTRMRIGVYFLIGVPLGGGESKDKLPSGGPGEAGHLMTRSTDGARAKSCSGERSATRARK